MFRAALKLQQGIAITVLVGGTLACAPVFTQSEFMQNHSSTAYNSLRNIPSKLGVNVSVGPVNCMDFGDTQKKFGSVGVAGIRNWTESFHYLTDQKHLAIETRDGNTQLLQKFEPTSEGSDRVRVGYKLQPARSYRLIQSFFLEPGWEWGGDRYQGGKLGFGFGGGTAPSGGIVDAGGFTARIIWRGHSADAGKYDGTGRLAVYSYAADRVGRYGQDHQIGDYSVPIGEWFTVMIEIKANSATNASDGGMSAWINGSLLLHEENIAWQLKGEKPVIDKLTYASFYGGSGSGWAPSKTTYARFKNVCWAPVYERGVKD